MSTAERRVTLFDNTAEGLRKQIKEKETELEKLRSLLLVEEKREIAHDVYKLAAYLHEKKCKANHTDGCGWYYENSDKAPWEGYAHSRYLKMAEKLTETAKQKSVDVAVMLSMVETYESMS